MAGTRKVSRLVDTLRAELPRLVREDTEVRGQLIAVLSEYLTTREETAAILAELRQMRADFDRRMDEQGRRIEEQGRRIEEHTRMLGAVGARWGILNEEAFRAGVRALFAGQPEVQVERWLYRDQEGRVFGQPTEVEVDAVIRDGVHVLVEIKSSVSAGDVATFARKAALYGEVTGQHPVRTLIISPYVDARAVELAQGFGIELCVGTAPPPL
jgi:hypothetical protein